MRISRKHIAALLSAFALAAVILFYFFNTLVAGNREQVQQELQRLLGKDVSFGRLKASLWGGLGFSAQEFYVADDPHFAATPFVHAKELRLGVSVWQLLLGKVVIDSLTFRDAEFQIITNEDGLVNTSALVSRKKTLRGFPRFQITPPEKVRSPVSFTIGTLKIINGRLDFIDRSVKEPAELQVRNIDLEAKGLDAAGGTQIKFTAAVSETSSHDVRIEGRVGPVQPNRDWSQQPLDLQMQFDSLYLPAVARALPFLRNKIPRELDVTGPMSFQANLAGTLQRPRLTGVTLKVPVFGSSDYNAVLEGAVVIPENRDWGEAETKGTLTLDRINLALLRGLPFWQDILPPTLTTEGSVSVSSRFEGAWNRLRVGLLVEAGKSEFGFGDRLRKPVGMAAKLRAQISRQRDGLVLHPSSVNLGNSQMMLSGWLENSAAAKVQFKLHSDRGDLAAWAPLVPPLSYYVTSGSIDWDILFERNFSTADRRWNLRGKLNLAGATLRHKETGTKVEALNAAVSFLGTEARVETASFRIGSSQLAVTARIGDLSRPLAVYKLSSKEINLADIPAFSAGASMIRLRNVSSDGEVEIEKGVALLKGTVASTDGNLKNIPYTDLRAELAWLPVGLSVRKLSLQAFNGTIRSDGLWIADASSQRFEFAPKFESIDIRSFAAQTIPQLQNRISGQLDFTGEFKASTQTGTALRDAVKGSGEASIRNGTINDFNLVTQFLLRSKRGSRSSQSPASMVALMDRRDTPFEILKANFRIDQQGVLSLNLFLSTPEYTINGGGWMKFDRTVKLNGLLLLSPVVTQELLREYKTIRYFVDRRGRLAVSFRMEGTLPNVNIRPENRLLAQALRWGLQGANESADSENKPRRDWFPQSLEKLLNR